MIIKNLSSGQEDMFLITIKDGDRETRILVDGGNSKTRIKERMNEGTINELEYVVLTHIDGDHIRGLLELFKNNNKYRDTEIIYNKFVNGMISYKQAEEFEKMIGDHNIIVSYKEYQDSSNGIKFLSVDQRLKLKNNDSDIYLTFLWPPKETVAKLQEDYEYCKRNKITSSKDTAEIVNRSSIMFMLEHNQKRILMLGDGYIEDIIGSIKELTDKENCLKPIEKADLIKIPHHGSEKNNEKLDELINMVPCDNFIITNCDSTANSSVKISDKLKNTLNRPTIKIYVTKNSEKYSGLENVDIKSEIDITT